MINTEAEFLGAARKRVELDEDILRNLQKKVVGYAEFALIEAVLLGLQEELAAVQAQMDEYDARVNADRKGAWMPMTYGSRFWPEDPRPQDIDIRDVAHSLARINRFNGRIKYDCYSVAQHSVLVSRLLPPRLRLFGLMHDAGEAYLGDLITPIKRLFRDFYEEVEDRVMRAVAERYGFLDVYLPPEVKAVVKGADTVLLATEARDVTVTGFVSQRLTELPMYVPITDCWSPEKAQKVFLWEFENLTGRAA